MEPNQSITLRNIGHLRIYLTRGERMRRKGWRRFFSHSLFHHIIDAAKHDGILNATAHTAHYGFTDRGKLQFDGADGESEKLAMFVELVAEREELERFVSSHMTLLKGKIMVYKHIEQWEINGRETESSAC